MLFALILTSFLGISLCDVNYKVTDQVYMDIEVGGKPLGRIVIGLFGDVVPHTVKNFLTIAAIGINGKTYAGTQFHRVIKRFMIQGGDIVNNDGTGSISIYGPQFKDENFEVQHSSRGFVSMANSGPNTNGCQFFITTSSTPWLNNHHTAFGKVVKGLDIIMKIERLKTNTYDRPLKSVIITNCGVLPTPYPYNLSDSEYNILEVIRAGALPIGFSCLILTFFHYVIRKLQKYEKLNLHEL